MAEEFAAIKQLLDDLAVKIMMVEPGDLSAVGDLLEISEAILADSQGAELPLLSKMVTTFKNVLAAIIMAELSDSQTSYDHLAKSVGLMQDLCRDSSAADRIGADFVEHIHATGFEVDAAEFGGSGGSAAVEEQGEIDLRFLEDEELLSAFLEESDEHLNAIEANILALEQTPGDAETINTIFRSFHTIKGIAGCTDLETISHLAHSTENLLDEIRNDRHEMDAEVIDVVLAVCDRLAHMVNNVRDVFEQGVEQYKFFEVEDLVDRVNMLLTTETEAASAPVEVESPEVAPEESASTEAAAPVLDLGGGEIPDFMQDQDLVSGFIQEAFEHLEAIEGNVLDLEQDPDDVDLINNIFRPFHTIKGVSGFLNLTTINKLAHSTENLLDDVRNNRLPMGPDIIDVVLGVGDFLTSMVQNISDVLDQGVEVYKQYDISEWVTRIKALQAGEAPPAAAPVPPQVEESTPAPELKKEVTAAAVAATPSPAEPPAATQGSPASVPSPAKNAPAGKSKKVTKIGASIKVGVEKLDGLVNAVGELVIMQAMVQQNPLITEISEPKLNKDFAQLSRITTELQKTAMSMRMVPIRQTFQKMTRLVRDLSKKSGKVVDLVMEGEETEIDRNMVDSIYDPLVHMMRNSVDHGVQPPAEREALGKSEKGMVKLSAYHKGGNIIIEIMDDGQGVNTTKIREKAVERGLMGENDNISDHEINNLIFLPGFSTADKITDVSGRGVGMDVVKKAVEKLRGKCELISTPGEGTQFLMRLPLTLAIIDGIIVRVGRERYIIPTIAIHESMRPHIEFYNTIQGQGETLMIREALVPLIRLYHVFGVEGAATDLTKGIVVVIENEGRRRALFVDELLGKQEVVIKTLGGYLTDIKGLAGGTILGDGRVGLILDLAGLIAANEELGGPDLCRRENVGQSIDGAGAETPLADPPADEF